MTEQPATPAAALGTVVTLCRQLGHDPADVLAILVEPDRVTVTCVTWHNGADLQRAIDGTAETVHPVNPGPDPGRC